MVEEDVINRKSRKGIHKRAEHSVILVFHKAGYICVGRKACKRKFQDKKGSHKVGNKIVGERNGQPEKRAAQQIETVRADKIGAKIGAEAPADVEITHGGVSQFIKRNLLSVEIAVKYKIALIPYYVRNKQCTGHNKGQSEGHKIFFLNGSFGYIINGTSHILTPKFIYKGIITYKKYFNNSFSRFYINCHAFSLHDFIPVRHAADKILF